MNECVEIVVPDTTGKGVRSRPALTLQTNADNHSIYSRHPELWQELIEATHVILDRHMKLVGVYDSSRG